MCHCGHPVEVHNQYGICTVNGCDGVCSVISVDENSIIVIVEDLTSFSNVD